MQYVRKFFGGEGWIRTSEGIASRFTVCPLWPTRVPLHKKLAGAEGFEAPTRGFGVRCSTVGATPLCQQALQVLELYFNLCWSGCQGVDEM